MRQSLQVRVRERLLVPGAELFTISSYSVELRGQLQCVVNEKPEVEMRAKEFADTLGTQKVRCTPQRNQYCLL